jgi:predicted dehydrogenase
MNHRIAIAGFRHGHIFSLLEHARVHPQLTVEALCEEDLPASLMPAQSLVPDYTSFEAMLEQADCDIVGLGDAYGKRGNQAIMALQHDKHVIADKPLCTSLEQLESIRSLATQKKLSVGLMLNLRGNGNYIAMRELIHAGRIGEVQTITITGQHPLRHGQRPDWYFQEGMHGGTFNDIGIHGIDIVQWLSSLKITECVAARSWNAKARFAPRFNDCAQCILRLENGAGVLADFSYLAPDQCGFGMANYWRATIHGTKGCVETSSGAKHVIFADDSSATPEQIAPAEKISGGYLVDFLSEINGNPRPDGLNTESGLLSSRIALELEQLSKNRSSRMRIKSRKNNFSTERTSMPTSGGYP